MAIVAVVVAAVVAGAAVLAVTGLRSGGSASSSEAPSGDTTDAPRPAGNGDEADAGPDDIDGSATATTALTPSTTAVSTAVETAPTTLVTLTLPPTSTVPPTTTSVPTTTSGPVSVPARPEIVQVVASTVRPDSSDACGDPTTYPPEHLVDQLPDTAWMAPGDGVGQTLTFVLAEPARVTTVGLIPGYAKNDACTGANRFEDLRQIVRVRWSFDDGTQVEQVFDPPTATLTAIVVEVVTSRVDLTILETSQPGIDRLDHAPISEVVIL